MTDLTLTQILNLVGRLDDATGAETPKERFRKFLKDNVSEIGQINDYIGECLRNSGEQYNRALQDLINQAGNFLGFDVIFGRYHGVRGEIGFDGHWISPKGLHIVVEVKTTDVYAIKTATLIGYINNLISEKKIPGSDQVLGLYVIGRSTPEVKQLENTIIAEKRTDQLRIISMESLISLAGLISDYDISHDDILAIIWPSGPRIDNIADLITRLIAQEQTTEEAPKTGLVEREKITVNQATEIVQEGTFWLTPVKDDESGTAEETILTLVGKEKIYAIGERTPGRRLMKPGDKICFYATARGVMAHAEIVSHPENKPNPAVRHPEDFPWTFRLSDVHLYVDNPVVVDAALRQNLDAFRGRDISKAWAWFVQATHKLTSHDFSLLIRST